MFVLDVMERKISTMKKFFKKKKSKEKDVTELESLLPPSEWDNWTDIPKFMAADDILLRQNGFVVCWNVSFTITELILIFIENC